MRLLVLGGTSFIGRHIVEAALAADHDVTVFNRGRTNPDLFPDADRRAGDRAHGDYASLGQGRWDATVDVSAYVPRAVEQFLTSVGDRSGHYVQVSSVAAYDVDRATPDEDAPIWSAPGPDTEEITAQTYGPLKAACEHEAGRLLPNGFAVVRPTFVAGPWDNTDRFTWWARRMGQGGRIPFAWPDTPLQIVDVRDLAILLLACAADGAIGSFDACGPSHPQREFLDLIAAPGVAYELVDVGGEALTRNEVTLPLFTGHPSAAVMRNRPAPRARSLGLSPRSVQQTAEATRVWDAGQGMPGLAAGPSPEQEQQLLDASAG